MRNQNIDIIKIVAMFMVLALHLHVYMPIRQSIPHYIYGFCGIAIPLFFMVSGFLMAKKPSNLQYVIRKMGGGN